MHQLAQKLNETLDLTCVGTMLSSYGRRMYVPKGIIVQSTEAGQKANKFNATIGVALEHGTAMCLAPMREHFAPSMKISEIFPYAPMGGVPALRALWKERMYEKNPTMKGKNVSLPVVTSGLTNSLSLVFSLFVDDGDNVILPDMYWENYDLIIDERSLSNKVLFPMFANGQFNVAGLEKVLENTVEKKTVVLLNFPNNPTGYSPTKDEVLKIVEVLKKYSNLGKKLIVITDDAYFGLFFEDDVCKESLFAYLCDSSENLLAIKCDAATKEELVWGFRTAFITYGCKNMTNAQYDALVQKTLGAVRGSLSSCTTASQNILLKGMTSPSYYEQKKEAVNKIEARYKALKEALAEHKEEKELESLPFNSGYFMTFKCLCDAESLRQLLLDKYGTGVIRLDDHHVRIAFSSVDVENISSLVAVLYTAAREALGFRS